MNEPTARFLRACRGLPVDRTPIWLMRQAGRYLPEYRALRTENTMLECINDPALTTEITLQPIRRFGFDAAIIFSDILPPLQSMGLSLEFVSGVGPVIHNPLRTPAEIDRLATPPAESSMQGTLDAIPLVVNELGDTPLIGFCGAPFTLASYAIEGGGSKNYARTKALMFNEPAAWARLMGKFVTVMADYLIKQAHAGASALQIFDSWAGLALSRAQYERFVQPYNTQLITAVKRRVDLPVIMFGTGTYAYLDAVAACGSDVVGIDWRVPLGAGWAKVGYDTPVQGNLDPTALLGPWRELRHQIDDVLTEAGGRPGHIFNLGHGIFKNTPIDNVTRMVEYVREQTTRPMPVAA